MIPPFRSFMLALLLCCSVLLPGVPHAQEPLLVTSRFPPFTGENLPHKGVCSWIVQQAMELAGYEFRLDFRPWKRGEALVRRHDRLGTFPYVKTPKRQKDFVFSKPLMEVFAHLFVKVDSKVRFAGETDLQGLMLCMPFGYSTSSFQKLLDAGVVRLTINRPYTLRGCFHQLEVGAVDGVVINSLAGSAVLEQHFPPGVIRMEPKAISTNAYHLMVARDHPRAETFLQAFNTALARLKESGEQDRLIRGYFLERPGE